MVLLFLNQMQLKNFFMHANTLNPRMHINTTRHVFKWVNNSRWVIACVVLTPAPYVHRLHHYHGNWSASSLPAPTHCKASVSHSATTSGITLPQHKEKAVMHDGLCAGAAYRLLLSIFPCVWEICFYILHAAEYTELPSTEEVIWLFDCIFVKVFNLRSVTPRGVHGGIPWRVLEVEFELLMVLF